MDFLPDGGAQLFNVHPNQITALRSQLLEGAAGVYSAASRAARRPSLVGMTGQGFDVAQPYKRTAESYADDVASVFDGVDTEVFGDTPSLVFQRGAARTGNPLLRADMAYAALTGGGEVFSVGSIAYCGSLSYNNYDNDISLITANVLTKVQS